MRGAAGTVLSVGNRGTGRLFSARSVCRRRGRGTARKLPTLSTPPSHSIGRLIVAVGTRYRHQRPASMSVTSRRSARCRRDLPSPRLVTATPPFHRGDRAPRTPRTPGEMVSRPSAAVTKTPAPAWPSRPAPHQRMNSMTLYETEQVALRIPVNPCTRIALRGKTERRSARG